MKSKHFQESSQNHEIFEKKIVDTFTIVIVLVADKQIMIISVFSASIKKVRESVRRQLNSFIKMFAFSQKIEICERKYIYPFL